MADAAADFVIQGGEASRPSPAITEDSLRAYAEDRLRAQVLPRRPFALQPVGPAAGPPPPPRTVDELSRRITELEPDHKGVPVLLRQYLRLGARVLAFNVDRHFGDALDGLMMLDLRLVEPALLARYMGTAGMTAFRQYHGLESQPNIRPRPAIVPPHVACLSPPLRSR